MIFASAVLLHVICLVGADWAAFLESKDYLRFPKAFQYDDYEECRRVWRDDYRYCIVKAAIVPNPSSDLWQALSDFSTSNRHYNHTLLERGLCLPNYTNGTVEDISRSKYFQQHINRELVLYDYLEVSPEVAILYCYDKKDEQLSLDFVDILFLAIVSLIVTLVTLSTVYDMVKQSKAGYPENYFSLKPKTRREQLLSAFCLIRNFQLVYEPTETAMRCDLQVMEAFRAVQIFLIMLLHSFVGSLKLPQRNPDFFESENHGIWAVGYIARFQDSVQTFFLISAILLTVNFLRDRENGVDLTWRYIYGCIVNRMIRIVPSYALVILFQASMARHFVEGPFGKQFIGEATANCRAYWWTNILFINNHISAQCPCLLQSWYLATDTQLYIVGLLTLGVVWKYRFLKVPVFLIAIVSGLIVPALTVYHQDTTPVMVVDMKTVDQYIRTQPYQRVLYFPFQQNTMIYFSGMMIGWIYTSYRERPSKLFRMFSFSVFAFLSILVHVFTTVTISWFVEYYPSLRLWFQAVYATVFKHSFGLINALVFLILFLLPRNNWMKVVLRHPLIGVMGKLAYSMYLLHFTVIVLVFGQAREPIFVNKLILAGYAAQIFFWTYAFSVALCVTVELPVMVTLRTLWFSKWKRVSEQQPIAL